MTSLPQLRIWQVFAGHDDPLMLDSAEQEAISALVALGYKPAQAEKVVKAVAKDDMRSEDLIREALRSMV